MYKITSLKDMIINVEDNNLYDIEFIVEKNDNDQQDVSIIGIDTHAY